MPSPYRQTNGRSQTVDVTTKYCFEAGRSESFENWPHDGLCSPDNMAKAGFYFTGRSDLVKCFTCRVKLDDWDPESDDPWTKHKELSPNCCFANFGKEEGNLTVEEFCDVMCARAINRIDHKFNKLINS